MLPVLYSPECVEKLSKKPLGGVSSVGIAGMTQRYRPCLPCFRGSYILRLGAGGTFLFFHALPKCRRRAARRR